MNQINMHELTFALRKHFLEMKVFLYKEVQMGITSALLSQWCHAMCGWS